MPASLTDYNTQKQVPGYYEQIKLPLAIDTIEQKLNTLQYPNLTALESDFKRMVQNAKDFNDKKSLIFEDAERVRKGASNWFVRHNPAYNDKNYVARPTPISGEGVNGTPAPVSVSLKITNKAAPVAVRTPALSETPGLADGDEDVDAEGEEDGVAYSLGDYKGKTFQQAQVQLIEELIDYQEYVAPFCRSVIRLTYEQSRCRLPDIHAVSLPPTPIANRLLPSHYTSCLAQGTTEASRWQSWPECSNRKINIRELGSP
jgi:hypothetical protein